MATWNVRGMSDKMVEIISQVEKYDIDIITLSETKRKGCGNEEIREYLHIWSGVEKHQRALSGISILIKNKFKRLIQEYEYVSDRIVTVTIKIFGHTTKIIGVYAPVDNCEQTVKDQFYEKLSDTINKTKRSVDIIIAGDLNARVKRQDNDEVIGKFAEDVENDNGTRLKELCHQFQLQLSNTRFAHKNIHRFTWERPSLKQKSLIDYIIVKQRPTFQVYDCRVKRGANCGTDHHLVLAKLVYPYPKKQEKNKPDRESPKTQKVTNPRYKLHLLHQSSIQYLYQRRLTTELNLTEKTENIEDEYKNIKKCIHKAATEALGKYEHKRKKAKQPIWLTDELKQLIDEKNKLYAKYLSKNCETNRQSYKDKNREVRRRIKHEKNLFWEQKCGNINAYLGGSQCTEVWKTIKSMKSKRREKISTVTDLNEWKKYYETLLTETREEWKAFRNMSLSENETQDEDECRPVGENELQECLKAMKSQRSPGPGDISAELLKNGGPVLLERLRHLMNLCLHQTKTPKEWKTCYISSLFKKGDRKNLNNYRGISVVSTMSRLWGKLILNRLRTDTEGVIGEDQSGFIVGRSCVDNLFTLQQLIEKTKSVDQELHITFIDLTKAYDNVPRSNLWQALYDIKVSKHLIKIIQELYTSNIAHVKLDGKISDPLYPDKGLRQGCSLSPILFNLYVERALRNWKRSCAGMGIKINNASLYTLSFADDQAIIAQDSYDMEFMLRRLYTEYEKWGLQVSLQKTEYLVINSDVRFEVLIKDDTFVKQVNTFKYLGVTIDKDGIGQQEIHTRTKKARQVVGALNSIWWDKNISKENKKRIGKTMVETVLTYGCEVWALKEEDKKRIRAVEMDYLRRSAGRSRLERIRNEQIRLKMSAQETVIERIEKKSLRWFGHLLRMNDERLPKQIFIWKPPGRRKRGRPRRSWNEGIRRAMRERNLEEDMAFDRDIWRAGMEMQHIVV